MPKLDRVSRSFPLRAAAAALVALLSWESASAAVANAANRPAEFRAEEFLAPSAATSGLRDQITRSLDDPSVAAELAKRGVDRAEFERRLAGMTDRELAQVRDGVQREAGGDSVTIGTTTLLLIIIIIILLV